MAEKITYRDYLTQRVANAISALADGLSTGMDLDKHAAQITEVVARARHSPVRRRTDAV